MTRSGALVSALLMVIVAGCSSQPAAPPSPATSDAGKPAECNALGDRLTGMVPQASQAGYVCTDPARLAVDLYVAHLSQQEVRALTTTMRDKVGPEASFTVIPVRHSEQEIVPLTDVRAWPAAARKRLSEGLVGTAFDVKKNSLELATLTSTTWSEDEAARLLGVRVTRRETDSIPKAGGA